MTNSSYSQQHLLNINESIPNSIERNSGRSTVQSIELSPLSNVAIMHSPKASEPNSMRFSFGISRNQLIINPQL